MAKPAQVTGLRPETAARVAGPLLVRARLADVRRTEAAAVALDPDGVHDMRVAIRRLRAALRLFARPRRKLDRELKALQDVLGALRDAQVQLAWLESSARRLGAADATRLRGWFGAPLDALGARARDAVGVWARDIAPRVERTAGQIRGGRKLGGRKLRRRLSKRTRRVLKKVPAVRADPAPRPAHRLRIVAKKARYLAELLEPGFPVEVRSLLERLVPLQETLGALHDADVRLERLGRAVVGGTAGERRTAKVLITVVARERERLAIELGSELDAFTASRRARAAS